jgi:hypothetical protein
MTSETGQPKLPPLYARPAVLAAERFGSKRLSPITGYDFARRVTALPLTVQEFGLACRSWPVVFGDDAAALPLVVLGWEGTNVAVEPNGNWRQGAYLPDYVRRYPFIFLHDQQNDRYVLCLDEAFPGLNDKEGEALFEDGKPSAFIQKVLEGCKVYQSRHDVTAAFCQELIRLDLLVPYQVQITGPDGVPKTVSGFRIVDEQRWRKVSDADLLKLRERGWIEPIIAHLISMQSWRTMAEMAAPAAPAAG